MIIIELLVILLLTLGLGLIFSGIFTAYFGRGKSRKVGISLMVLGLLIGILVVVAHQYEIGNIGQDYELMETVWNAIKVIIAFMIGGVIALGIFLVAIMKT
ncbi:MAG: hypothetical protein R6U17_04055 [Thermoplasmata archaeon]